MACYTPYNQRWYSATAQTVVANRVAYTMSEQISSGMSEWNPGP